MTSCQRRDDIIMTSLCQLNDFICQKVTFRYSKTILSTIHIYIHERQYNIKYNIFPNVSIYNLKHHMSRMMISRDVGLSLHAKNILK